MLHSSYKRERLKKPSWLRVRLPVDGQSRRVASLLHENNLHSVCVKAQCPNRGECWQSGTATFLIMGDVCTRNCRFCAVNTGIPLDLDENEPHRLVAAVKSMELRHVVVTSVTRDDLDDGGANFYARTIGLLHESIPQCTVEVLIPDFGGDDNALKTVLAANPQILAHNLETVPRLYEQVRPQAHYRRSLDLLAKAEESAPHILVKSGIMVGLGERHEEVEKLMRDLREIGCDIMTIGQYLQPSQKHLPVMRYWQPDEYDTLKRKGISMGFQHIEAGPLVRSSYHAEKILWQK